MTESGDGVRVELVDHVMVVTLDRPRRGNSLVPEMRAPMAAAWRRADEDDEVRAVVVTGTGSRHFCTGVDVAAVAAHGRTTTGEGSATEEIVWSPLLAGVRTPVVAAVNGMVVGGGLHFVADADVVVAGSHAEFLDSHVSIGMVSGPEAVGLTRRMPIGAVLRMVLEGRSHRLPAQRAYELGLVDLLCRPGDELTRAFEVASAIARNSPTAVRMSKQAVWDGVGMDHLAGAERAWQLVKQHRGHPDFIEGPRSFAEKREPRWQDAATPPL